MPTRTASSPTTARASWWLGGGLALLATAATPAEYPPADRPLDFALYLSRVKTDLDYPSERVPTRIDRIGIQWRERYAPLWLGVMGGYSYVTQTQHPATAGLEIDGYHVGLTFDIDLYQTAALRLTLGGGYLYERVEAQTRGDDVELAWRIPWARFLTHWRAIPRMEIYGGIRHDALNGEERLRGAIRSTVDVERDAQTAGIVGLRVQLDESGYVMLEGYDSATRSVALYFGRRY